MDTANGGQYWGRAGQTPGWQQNHDDTEWSKDHPGAFPRYSGAGEYAGLLVVVIAIWGLAYSLRRSQGIFSDTERWLVWFWSAAALIALLLSWGYHAPF